ncbi:MAG: DUF6046 domain-containing protein [Bacteroidota bacterium]
MISIKALYIKVFGSHGRALQDFETEPHVNDPVYVDDIDVYSNSIDEDDGNYDIKSIFGTPIHMPVKIGDYWLPNEPLVTLTGGKNIVKTVVTGLVGTVKEEVSTNDYQITIKGIIVNEESDDYPEADVAKLREICQTPGMHDVVNKLFRIFLIDNIVIESYNIYGIAGEQSQQAYQINAWSDRPVELILREGV